MDTVPELPSYGRRTLVVRVRDDLRRGDPLQLANQALSELLAGDDGTADGCCGLEAVGWGLVAHGSQGWFGPRCCSEYLCCPLHLCAHLTLDHGHDQALTFGAFEALVSGRSVQLYWPSYAQSGHCYLMYSLPF